MQKYTTVHIITFQGIINLLLFTCLYLFGVNARLIVMAEWTSLLVLVTTFVYLQFAYRRKHSNFEKQGSISFFYMLLVDWCIVSVLFDQHDFLMYRFASREILFATAWCGVLHSSILNSVRITIKERLPELKTEVSRLIILLFVSATLLIATSHWVIEKISSELQISASIFNYYLLLVMVRVLFSNTILLACKYRTRKYVQAIEIILNILLSIYLARLIGLKGVVVATVISSFVMAFIAVFIVRYRFKIQLREYLPVGYYLIFTFLLLVVFTFVEFIIY